MKNADIVIECMKCVAIYQRSCFLLPTKAQCLGISEREMLCKKCIQIANNSDREDVQNDMNSIS